VSAIETVGLTKRYGPVTAVDDLSFSVRDGAVTGFLGPNGAGKTTTLRIGTSFVFVLIVLVWFYALSLILLAGAVVNELRFEGRRPAQDAS
jgi:ABC-type ATPase involved in cell division